jgi:hypothetical protein
MIVLLALAFTVAHASIQLPLTKRKPLAKAPFDNLLGANSAGTEVSYDL